MKGPLVYSNQRSYKCWMGLRAEFSKKINGLEVASGHDWCKRRRHNPHLADSHLRLLIPPLWHFPWHPVEQILWGEIFNSAATPEIKVAVHSHIFLHVFLLLGRSASQFPPLSFRQTWHVSRISPTSVHMLVVGCAAECLAHCSTSASGDNAIWIVYLGPQRAVLDIIIKWGRSLAFLHWICAMDESLWVQKGHWSSHWAPEVMFDRAAKPESNI